MSLSDFNSCVSSPDMSDTSSDEEDIENKHEKPAFKTANEKKRAKKVKRKLNLTPGKDQFLKKQNTQISPI